MLTIFDIKRFALHDGPGIRTTVFLKGCPLNCLWCHNPESHSSEPEEYTVNQIIDGKELAAVKIYGKKVDQLALMDEILRDRVFFEESGGGVTFSGGEPLLQYKDLLKILQELGGEGIHRAVDTSGYANENVLKKVLKEVDLFLYDLKIMDPLEHKKFTGVDNTTVHRNFELILEAGVPVIVRIPYIPGVNDSQQEEDAFISFLERYHGSLKELHILPFHKIGREKYRRMEKDFAFGELDPPPESKVNAFKNEIEKTGIEVRIGG